MVGLDKKIKDGMTSISEVMPDAPNPSTGVRMADAQISSLRE